MSSEHHDVTISRLGAQGDGVVETAAGEVFIAGALPGERWRLGADDTPPQRLSDSPDRQTPICRHFGVCGGCAVQHMSEACYRAWKHGTVVQAFAHRGIAADVAPLEGVALHSRRRAVFGIARRGRIHIGFREAGRHTLVDLAECPVLDRRIADALPALRDLAGLVLVEGDSGRLTVTATDTGLDATLSTGGQKPSPDLRAHLAAHARAMGLARLAVERETVAELTRPRLMLGGITVEPPNGIFMQAVPEAEARLVELVIGGIGKARRIADLFCGIGTFTFPLARKAQVLAVDDDKAALATLTQALRSAQGLKRIETKRRDLFLEPLSPMELNGFDVVVIDPPRAGAKAQSEAIARSKVNVVVAVSCNPATLARDARILIDAGFKLGVVTPIDQFRFSAHVEAVAVLRR